MDDGDPRMVTIIHLTPGSTKSAVHTVKQESKKHKKGKKKKKKRKKHKKNKNENDSGSSSSDSEADVDVTSMVIKFLNIDKIMNAC